MRVRNRKGATELLEANPQYVVLNPEDAKGKWHEIFGNDHPIHIEVGSGKGAFITGMAKANPEINYIGIDIQKSVLSYALDKVLEADVPNIKLLWVDGDSLTNYFEDGEIDQLYLNFSDPWPKKRHEKRRLTYKTFLDTFKQILPEHGEIHFKTDNRGLFEYSLVSFSQYGMTLKGVWLDLHASDFEGNVMTEYEEKFSVKYDVSFSIQKPSTDTVAAAMDNTPFRDKNDKLLFRPGGHGALIENLNDVDADVVFIKNIDNVVPDSFKCSTVIYKKVIAGVLVTLQEKAFRYLEQIETGKYTHAEVEEMIHFLQDDLCIKNPDTKLLEDAELILYIKSKLLRPLRVCGMVKNVGEPGGGPFLAVNPDGTVSLQVLESSQIDMSDPAKKAMFEKGTHFNPVDLVCAVKNHKGEKYNLPDYVDKNTGFISYKSKDGRELKALELPGLWNGAMSDWNTVFVEVPIETFNPVKTVNDLLRPEHQ